MKLRSYQTDAVNEIWAALRTGKTAISVISTGGGKTVVMLEIIRKAIAQKPDIKIVFLVQKNNLLYQTVNRINTFLPDKSVSIFNGDEKDLDGQIVVGTIQSLYKTKFEKLNMIIVDECFSGDTEILTENGFIRFDSLQNEMVAQVEKGSFKMSFVKPIRKIKKLPKDDLLLIKSDQKIDLLLTKNHEMLTTNMKGEWKKVFASDLVRANYCKIMTCGYASGTDNVLSCKEKFAICYQADGSTHYISEDKKSATYSFSFSKERKIECFLELIKQCGFKLSEVKTSKPKNKNTKQKRRFLVKTDLILTKNISDFIPIKNIGIDKCKKIIEYMNIWDGHICKDNKEMYLYTNANKESADFYHAIACMSGYKTSMTVVHDKRKSTYKKIYRLFIKKDGNTITTQGFSINPVKYDGHVFCVEVPTGLIIVRRNGKTAVVGNCHNLDQENGRYKKFIDLNDHERLKIVGVTATPMRGTEKIFGEGKLFKDVCYKLSLQELINMGFLVRPSLKKPDHQIDTGSFKIRNGEYAQEDVERAVTNNEVVSKQIADALPRISDRKKIVWACSSINHCDMIFDQLKLLGEKAAKIHSKMNSDDRDKHTDYFENGDARHLVFVTIVSEGWDYPPTDAVIFLRPTRSAVLYIQTVGRCLRPSDGKKDALVLDYGNVVATIGPIDSPKLLGSRRSKKEKEDDKKQRVCPACREYLFSFSYECPNCNHELVKRPEERLEKKTTTANDAFILRADTKPVQLKISNVRFRKHISKNKNVCFQIIYEQPNIFQNGINEYFVYDKAFSIKKLQQRLIELDCDIMGTIDEQILQRPRKIPKAIETKDNKGYTVVTKLFF